MLRARVSILLLWFATIASAQTKSNFRTFSLESNRDTIQLDTLSIVENSFFVKDKNGSEIAKENYYFNPYNASFAWLSEQASTLYFSYRTYPYLFTQRYFNKDPKEYKEKVSSSGYILNTANNDNINSSSQLVDFGKLDYNGNLSRGVGFGNAQSLNINSNFNLQLAGMITDDIEVMAAITDNNIPIQPEGNTAQLQEFDKVFIQLRKDQHYLRVGDFDLVSPPSYFMKFQRNLQGASYKGIQEVKNFGIANGMASFAVSRGKFVINNITAQEGNQGPYRLKGPNGETFIIVLAGSERVFINGVQQSRGANLDYVIDYNVGEITFTPNKMITQDMRIRVEFEYADRYYLRSIYHVNGGFEHDKFKVDVNFFSQQDAKNQSINQDLDDAKTNVLENIGDDIQNAFASGINQVEFDASRVLYAQRDTLINGQLDTFYVYSTNQEEVLYSLTFSLVGAGQGSYEPVSSVANGRVYEYKGPNLASYEPVVLLIAPQKQQLLDTRFTYKATKNLQTGFELAMSNYDLNTFSDLDQEDNIGVGLNLFLQQNHQFKKDSLKSIQISGSYEFKQDQFRPLERYRAVEFVRNWNLEDNLELKEQLANASFQFQKENKGSVSYQLAFLKRDSVYQGFENSFASSYQHAGFENNNSLRMLFSTSPTTSTQFIRPQLAASYKIKKLKDWKLGLNVNNEINKIKSLESDSLLANSFLWQEYGALVASPDSSKSQVSLSYKLRYQHYSNGEEFEKAYLKAHNLELKGRVLSKKNHNLLWNLNYRNLQQDTLFNSDNDLEHFYLGRIDYSFQVLKGAVRSNSLYEIGAGREQKIQYNYIEDPNGQGSFAWSDINENGVQEINEFYISAFANENRYIRIYTNSLEFQPVNSTRFNQSLVLNPKAVWFNEKGIKSFIARFSTNTSFQFNKKVFASKDLNFAKVISPFEVNIDDSLLVSSSTSIRNIIFFNRTDTKFGLEYSYQFNNSKTLLTSGFERRKYILNTFNLRWNFIENFTLNADYTTGFKQNDSDFFFDRKYEYLLNGTGLNVSWLFQQQLRIEIAYDYTFRSNPLPTIGGQFAVTNGISSTIKYSKANNYNLTAQINYTSVGYNDSSFRNEQLQFDMLQGLQVGNNYVWNVGIDKTFAKLLQVSVIYDGRKTGANKVVNSGRLQVRAIF